MSQPANSASSAVSPLSIDPVSIEPASIDTASPAVPDGQPRPAAADSVSHIEATDVPAPVRPREIGGRDGPEPTRFGDWEKNGRCIDF
jgi:hypothetical protein